MGEGVQILRGCVAHAVLMPHAPVLVPALGSSRQQDVAATIRAMREASREVVASGPEAMVVISPHAPRAQSGVGYYSRPSLTGDLRQFGLPDNLFELPSDPEFTGALKVAADQNGLRLWDITDGSLDHGTVVPLCFMAEAGWSGPTTVVALPDEESLYEKLGNCINTAAQSSGRRVALLASGDMSHALKPGGPAGYNPLGATFDATIIGHLQAGTYEELRRIDPDLRAAAAEDVLGSLLVAFHAGSMNSRGHKVLSYEGPFGVGYGVAILWKAENRAGQACLTEDLPRLARRSVESALRNGGEQPPDGQPSAYGNGCGVFVTIRDRDGELRGCVGSIQPLYQNVSAETWRIARETAFCDRRFDPIQATELDNLWFQVTLVYPPEKIASEADLDPARYGVIVTGQDGRRAVLLPGIAQITSTAEQVACARKKGRMSAAEPVELQRFEVEKFNEPDPPPQVDL